MTCPCEFPNVLGAIESRCWPCIIGWILIAIAAWALIRSIAGLVIWAILALAAYLFLTHQTTS
jgi:hypothetical protein